MNLHLDSQKKFDIKFGVSLSVRFNFECGQLFCLSLRHRTMILNTVTSSFEQISTFHDTWAP